MAMAKLAAIRSTCSSRPVGCVIVKDNRVLSTGYNGPPAGEPHCIDKNTDTTIYCERRANRIANEDKLGFCRAVHAEENAIKMAYTFNLPVEGASVYTTLSPCIRCIRKLRTEGIKHVFFELKYTSCNTTLDEEWDTVAHNSFETFQMLPLSFDTKLKLSGIFNDITSTRLLPSG